MTWFIPLCASLWLTCLIVWIVDTGRHRRLVSELAARWRQFSRGQAMFLCVLLIWAVAYGGSKSTNDAPENAQSGSGADASGVSSNSTSVSGMVAADTSTNGVPASSAPVDGVPASAPAAEVAETVPETEMTVHAGDPAAQQSPLMAPEGPLWSTFEYPSWPFDAFTSNAIVGMAATTCPPIPDVMMASGLALHRVTTNTVLVADTGAVPVRAWLNHGADNRGVFVDAPFAITLGTNSYTQVGILANGRLAFGYATYHRPTVAGLPFETPYPVVTVAPLWGPFALLPSAGSVAWTRTIAPDRFIVGWENLLLDGDPAQPATAQCEIRSDGTIRFLYGSLAEDVPAASTVGLQNLGTGWVYSHGHTNRLLSGMTVSLRPVGLDGWAEADPDSDLLSNFDEFMLGTDPVKLDTDGDGPSDLWELTHGFDPVVAQLAPTDPDFDGDKIPDRWETWAWMGTDTNNPASGPEYCSDFDSDGFVLWYEWNVLGSDAYSSLSPGPPDAEHTDVMAVVTSDRPCVLRVSGGGEAPIEIPWMPGVSPESMRLRLDRGQAYEATLSRVPSDTTFTTDGFWWANLDFVTPNDIETLGLPPVTTNGTVIYHVGTVRIQTPDRAGDFWLVPGQSAAPTNHVAGQRIAVDGPLDFCHESTHEQITLADGSLVDGGIQWSGLAGTNLYGRPLQFNPSEISPGSHTVTARSVDNGLVFTNFTVNIQYVGVLTNEVWLSADDYNTYNIALSSNTYTVGGIDVWSDPWGIDSLSVEPSWLEPGTYTVFIESGPCAGTQFTANVADVELRSLSFTNNYTITSDDGIQDYTAPHWVDPDGNGDATDGHAYPLCFARNARMTLTEGKWYVEPPGPPGTVFIKGDGPGNLDFPPTAAAVTGNNVTISNLQCSAAFANEVSFIDPLSIEWSVSFDGGRSWGCAGKSTNRTYVTLGTPVTNTTLRHTVVHLGCKNAAGQSSVAATASAIWDEFTDLSVARVSDGTQLTYYANWGCTNITTAELLASGDGQCGAWAHFLQDALLAQGIGDSMLKVIQPRMYVWIDDTAMEFAFARHEGLLVKNWAFTGTPTRYGWPTDANGNWVPDNFECTGTNAAYNLVAASWMYPYNQGSNGNDIVDCNGVSGQGTCNPLSRFNFHVIVKRDTTYYDPSYGRAFSSLLEWQNESIAGFWSRYGIGSGLMKGGPVNTNAVEVEECSF